MFKRKIKIVVDQDIRDLLPQYLNNRKNDFVSIQYAIDSADSVAIEKIVHKIKGNAESYGLSELGKLAIEIEKNAKKKDMVAVGHYLKKMQEYVDSIEFYSDYES
ncbi:MAG: Hpt domain-containing protein [Oligoflexia bacterium]|nr:Hpt domain-containing protein [Oligoflexia bacterium]